MGKHGKTVYTQQAREFIIQDRLARLVITRGGLIK